MVKLTESEVARVISALLAAGILEMRGIGGKPGWFWLFLLEGLLTFVIGVVVRLLFLFIHSLAPANTTLELLLSPTIPDLDQECPLAEVMVH